MDCLFKRGPITMVADFRESVPSMGIDSSSRDNIQYLHATANTEYRHRPFKRCPGESELESITLGDHSLYSWVWIRTVELGWKVPTAGQNYSRQCVEQLPNIAFTNIRQDDWKRSGLLDRTNIIF